MIGCNVRGVCGYIFDDFLEVFNVQDVEGEISKEVNQLPCFSWADVNSIILTRIGSTVKGNRGS